MKNFPVGTQLANGFKIVQIQARTDGRAAVLAMDGNTQFATWTADIHANETISLFEGNYFGYHVPSQPFDFGRYSDALKSAVDSYLELLHR